MQPHAAERRHLERQIAQARPIFLVLALGDLLERPPQSRGPHVVAFVLVYLGIALVLLLWQYIPVSELRVPMFLDLAGLAIFLLLTHSAAAFWFLYLFVALAAGIRWGLEPSILLAGVVTLGFLLSAAVRGGFGWVEALSWLAMAAATFTSGVGVAFLGDRNRRHAAEHEFLAQVTSLLRVDLGISESLRQLLTELARGFDSEKCIFAVRDAELDRVFVWTAAANQEGRVTPENLSTAAAGAFLFDRPEASVCGMRSNGATTGFGWNRSDGRRLDDLPSLLEPPRQFLNLRSFLSVSLDFDGQAVARILLCNRQSRYLPQDLRWFERVVRHLGSPLENLFLLRRLRTRAIEGERSRISREIHDGILQTLLSVDIQLDVLRRRLPQTPELVAAELGNLQKTVRGETEELRGMVTDMRPLGVQSADLVDLMRGFAERFRNESGLALDLLTDSANLQVPDRICRELFQIYREALYNVKKHAQATHVVVKLWQDVSRVVLVIDDNGEGFSFAGRFTGDELDRLRLGPISIKERTRSIGGVLTVESTPEHGSRLTIEVPLG